MLFWGPGASTTSTDVKPAAARYCRAVGQRDRHAVEDAHAVHPRGERVGEILLEVARGSWLERQVDTVGSERRRGASQDRRGVALVVNGVEGRDEVELRLRGQTGHV